jgi:hypothetical protein
MFRFSTLLNVEFVHDCAGLLNTFISGGVAGCALWTAMFPTDLIKSRIQVAGDTSPMWRVVVDIYRTEGERVMGLPSTFTALKVSG